MSETFDDWWKSTSAGSGDYAIGSADAPYYAYRAWDHQQAKIDALEVERKDREEMANIVDGGIRDMQRQMGESQDQLSKMERSLEYMRRDNERLAAANETIRAERFQEFHEQECWVYQGDGYDHLESLVCPVVISAPELLKLTAQLSQGEEKG